MVILRFPKIVLHNKIINNMWMTNNQENSTQYFGGNYLTNHHAKFLQGWIKPWRVWSFLNKFLSKDFITYFNLLYDSDKQYSFRGSFKKHVRRTSGRGREGVLKKRTKRNRRRGVQADLYVRWMKKIALFSNSRQSSFW